jgi:hypothetical protein
MKFALAKTLAATGLRWLAAWLGLGLALTAAAMPAFDTTTPASFFTNVADRVIRAETANWRAISFASYTNTFGAAVTNAFGVGTIPVYINGSFVYSPSIQRLLQVTANTFEAMSTNAYPAVYRPTFYLDPATGNVFINGFQLVASVSGITDPVLAQPVDVSAFINGNVPDVNNVNIYGVPWIIGARKGFPSFNELYVLSTVQVARYVQVNRASLTSFNAANYMTNQLFVMSISNSVGVSLWNSYNVDYVGSSNLTVYVHDSLQTGLTNANNAGLVITNFNCLANISDWPGSAWTTPNAAAPPPNTGSFFYTNWTQGLLPPAAYQFPSGLFVPLAQSPPVGLPWQTSVTLNYPFPQFGMTITNWMQAVILDGNQVIDYAQFSGPSRTRNLTAEIADFNYPAENGIAYMWSTNTLPPINPGGANPYGLVNQILLSRGSIPLSRAPPGGIWSEAPVQAGVDTSPAAQQAAFNGFFTPSWAYDGIRYYNTNLSQIVPYTPIRTMYAYTLWQANDPLVHYLVSDLNVAGTNGTSLQRSDYYPPTFNISGLALNQLGLHYQPWGVMGQMREVAGVDTNAINPAFKDPLSLGSDYWDFPTNQTWNPNWLGQVHRGTPWQTIYLKAADILSESSFFNGTELGTNTWEAWSGVTNSTEAQRTCPVSDWHLASLLCAILNTNPATAYFNVNNTNAAAWTVPFDGLTVVTNIATVETSPELSSNSPSVVALAGAILATQAGEPGGRFGDVGDVFSTVSLSTLSPFLNESDPSQELYGNTISDAMYEALPAQLLGQLGVASLGTVMFANGQWVAQFTGQTGYQYVLQSSADLIHWTNLGTNSPVLGVMSLPVAGPGWFYRSQLLP